MTSRRARARSRIHIGDFKDGEFKSAIFNTAWGHLKGQKVIFKGQMG